MSDLKPCPFCKKGKAYTIKPARYGKSWGVLCECGAFLGYYNTEAEAIAAWNNRAERVTDDEWESYKHSVPATEENMAKFGWVRERTCHDTGECRWFCCSECGCGINDAYINEEIKYGVFDDTFPRYCPNCGARRVGE